MSQRGPLAGLRSLLARLCPPTVLSRIVDQTLADLGDEIAEERSIYRRMTATLTGTARLLLAVLASLFVLSSYWHEAKWWPVYRAVAEVSAWTLVLTTLAATRTSFAMGPAVVTPVWDVRFLITSILPLVLPAAAAAYALTCSSRLTSTALAGAAIAAISLACSEPFTLAQILGTHGSAAGADSHLLELSAHWRDFLVRRSTEQDVLGGHAALSLSALCFTLPLLAMSLRQRFARSSRSFAALVALLTLEATTRYVLYHSVPLPLTTLNRAIFDVWLPNMVILGLAALCMDYEHRRSPDGLG